MVLGHIQRSGRVISLGRLMLAALFLLAIWLDASQPAQAAAETYALLVAYVAVSLAVAVATWNDWWLDARLAAPAHLVDVGIFMVLVLATEGYTSPFFLFFVFLLLSAAIRWGWRETALTGAVVVVLYLTAGLLVAASAPEQFELQRFVIRAGHLFILSAILIWFGVNQRFTASISDGEQIPPASPDEPPLETALIGASRAARAAAAVLLWREAGSDKALALRYDDGRLSGSTDAMPLIRGAASGGPFLYSLARDRAVARGRARRLLFARASNWLDRSRAQQLRLREGLAVPLRTDTGEGELFLERVDGLSIDHIEFGNGLAVEISGHLRRSALLRAVEEGGEARARLSLARDLHDSVVQFLAGAAFRIEAMMRHARAGTRQRSELDELKQLMLQEQEDLRSFIGGLRSGPEMRLPQLREELEALARKLSKQWNIQCDFSAAVPEGLIPTRLHLDAQQLVREAIANAVRHGRASLVRIRLLADEDWLRLQLDDNGSGFPAQSGAAGHEDLHPRSLKERVEDAGGELSLATRADGTSLTISLPIRGRQ